MSSLLLALVLAQVSAAEAPEPFPLPDDAHARMERAYALATEGKHDEATAAIAPLLTELPENPRLWQAAGFIALDRGHAVKAIEHLTQALALKIDDRRRPHVLVARAAARIRLGDRQLGTEQRKTWALAEEDLTAAEVLSPGLQGAELQRIVLAMARGAGDAARRAEAYLEKHPDDPFVETLLAAALANTGELERAGEVAGDARDHGASAPFLGQIEEAASGARWSRRSWQWLLGAAVLLFGGVIFLYLAAGLLSRWQLGALTAGTRHLLRAEQSPAERFLGRVYDGVLLFGCALYYASIPLLLILVLGTAGWIFYAMWAAGQIPIKIAAFVGVVAVGGVVAILQGLFTRGPNEEETRTLTEAEAPRLFEALREVAQVASSRMVDEVRLEPGAGISVHEAGTFWSVVTGKGKRILSLGYGAMSALSVTELKAVLAHEYGHFSHGETRLNPIIARVSASSVNTLIGMAEHGGARISPGYWFMRLYVAVFMRVSAAHSRRRELLADRTAALAYGGEHFGAALTKVVRAGDAFDRLATGILVALRRFGRPCHDIYACLAAAEPVSSAVLAEERAQAALNRKAGVYDSHPPPQERIARVGALTGTRGTESAPAVSLLEDPQKLALELTREVVTQIDIALVENAGLERAPEAALAPEAQLAAAAAVALHHDALDLQEKKDPAATRVLAEAISRMESAAGADSPLLVPVLLDLSRLQNEVGQRAGAAEPMARALGIIQREHGETSPAALELKSELEQLRAPLPG